MNDDTRLDEWRDRMVAALYDELPDDERRRLEERLAVDPELSLEWDEFRQTRRMLARLADDIPRGEVVAMPRRERPPGRRWWLHAAAGFAAAAALFVGLLAAGLRVDRADGGVLVRFGGDAVETPPAAALDPLVTRSELEAVAASVVEVTAARMAQLESRQAGVQAEMTRALYDALAGQQRQQYEDLRFRIERTAAQVGGWRPTRPAGTLDGALDQGGTHAID